MPWSMKTAIIRRTIKFPQVDNVSPQAQEKHNKQLAIEVSKSCTSLLKAKES